MPNDAHDPAQSAPLTRADILAEAAEVVNVRGLRYGSPEDNFKRIVFHWNAFMENRYGSTVKLTEADVALMMILVKVSRLENDMTHHDSWVDLAGYASCGAVCSQV